MADVIIIVILVILIIIGISSTVKHFKGEGGWAIIWRLLC